MRISLPKISRVVRAPGRGAAVLIAAAALIAGAHALPSPQRSACPSGTAPGVRAELMLGRNSGQELSVSWEDFQAFLEREVAPRFPDGFTVQDASGHWRDAAAAEVVREPSYALMIVLGDARAAAPKLRAIAEAYKRAFHQQSVLVAVSPTCFAL